MKVYRYLSERELNNILNKDTSQIGARFAWHNLGVNTHEYKHDENYLHFFKNKESMDEIREMYRYYPQNFYLCEFEIPKLVLYFAAGTGYYKAHGYDFESTELTEYAIRVSKFNPNWLKEYTLDKDKQKIMYQKDYDTMFKK